MNETQSILQAIHRLWQLGETAALATVVSVQGSAYRRPGARMLVSLGGAQRIGSVSGGCLEGDVARKAFELTQNGRAAVLRYDSTAEDDGLWGLGLGCNGIIEILVERVEPASPLVAFLGNCATTRASGVIATLFHSTRDSCPVGAHLFLDQLGVMTDPASLASQIPQLAIDARRALQSNQTATASYTINQTRIDALIEVVQPPTALVVFGAGWDAIPLVSAAKALGWHVTVVDRRSAHATRERFPLADQLIICPLAQAKTRLHFDPNTAAVLMTHHYPDDLHYLHATLTATLFYIGLLGPAKRRQRLLRDLNEQLDFTPTPSQLARLHGPTGLDIGADNPAEIATAITSEIIAAARSRPGTNLNQRNAPIHDLPHPLEPR